MHIFPIQLLVFSLEKSSCTLLIHKKGISYMKGSNLANY